MDNIKKLTENPSTRILLLDLLGFLIGVIGLWASSAFNLPLSSPINYLLITAMFASWGFSGLVIAKEKVYPGLENSRWVFPVFTGTIIMLGCWIIALYALWRMISVLLHLSAL